MNFAMTNKCVVCKQHDFVWDWVGGGENSLPIIHKRGEMNENWSTYYRWLSSSKDAIDSYEKNKITLISMGIRSSYASDID